MIHVVSPLGQENILVAVIVICAVRVVRNDGVMGDPFLFDIGYGARGIALTVAVLR